MYSPCLLLTALLTAWVQPYSAMDYCAAKLECDGKKNTFCQYPTEALGADCAAEDWLPRQDMEKLLRIHNEIRSKVARGLVKGQPSAANMRELEWHGELQQIARRWAKQCKATSDECRRTSMFKDVGQNIATLPTNKGTPKSRLYEHVDQWFSAKTSLNKGDLDKFPGGDGPSKYYTQLVWAESWLLGCGRSTTASGNELMICNYEPGGNVQGFPVYVQGPPCSQCHHHTHCSKIYPGLCTTRPHDHDAADRPTSILRDDVIVVTWFVLIALV